MPTIAAKRCSNCGAPVPHSPGQVEAICQYCGNRMQLEAPRAVKPGPAAATSSAAVRAVLAGTIAMVVAGAAAGFIVLRSTVGSVAGSLAPGVALPFAGEQNFPLNCGMNQEVTIVGRKFEGSGTLITADINCKVKIKDSTLKGDVVVRAKNLVEVSVENSQLEGKETAVQLDMNSKLFLSKNSRVTGADSAVDAGVNTEVSLDHSQIEGAENGIKADSNFKLRGNTAQVKGKEFALRGSNNIEIEGRDLTMNGERAAVEGEVNLKVDLRGGALEGGETALHLKGPNAQLKLSKGARLSARETALTTSSNLELEMEEALIDGGEIGVDTEVNPKLSLGQKARIHGKDLALKAGVNLELEMRGATLDSEGVAVCAPFNIEIRARDSKIQGGREAFRFQRRPNELELSQTPVNGAQNFSAKGCARDNATAPAAAPPQRTPAPQQLKF